MWMTSCTGSVRGGFGGIWRKSESGVEFCLGGRKLTFARALRPCVGCARDWGTDGKVVKERLCFSLPYVKKPLNSKVIKSFVPELRSRKCFSCFGIPMFYVYMLWTFYVRFTYPYHRYVTISPIIWNTFHLKQNFMNFVKFYTLQKYNSFND